MSFQRILLLFSVLFSVHPSVDAARKLVVPHDFPTIHIALGEASAGDTVFVTPGIYRENIALPDNVILLGQDMLRTIINGRGKAPCIIGADGAVVSGFTITNGTVGILSRNTIFKIERNFIVGNRGTGIHAHISLPDIKNNVIMRNDWSGIFLESVRGTRTAVSSNVIIENGYSGIFCANATEVLVKNNILEGNHHYGLYASPQARRTRITYNSFYNNRQGFSRNALVNKTNVSEPSFYRAPRFPDYNFYLADSSPLKGKGENGIDIGLLSAEGFAKLDTDKDADGIYDDIDLCPDLPEDGDGFEDDDGCPDFDNDADGLSDDDDECPLESEDVDGFQDADGCPDTDNDRDAIADNYDQCPDQPETINNFKDDDGCPDDLPEPITRTVILTGVNFRQGSSDLLEESYYILEKIFNSLEAYPETYVEIAGHTDNEGNSKFNQVLSYDRARSVMNYLVMRGIAPERITAVGYGDKRPVAKNDSPEGRKKNRRVEVIPVKGGE